MRAVYRSAPFFSSYAPAKAFPTAEEALRHARASADAFSIAYAVTSASTAARDGSGRSHRRTARL